MRTELISFPKILRGNLIGDKGSNINKLNKKFFEKYGFYVSVPRKGQIDKNNNNPKRSYPYSARINQLNSAVELSKTDEYQDKIYLHIFDPTDDKIFTEKVIGGFGDHQTEKCILNKSFVDQTYELAEKLINQWVNKTKSKPHIQRQIQRMNKKNQDQKLKIKSSSPMYLEIENPTFSKKIVEEFEQMDVDYRSLNFFNKRKPLKLNLMTSSSATSSNFLGSVSIENNDKQSDSAAKIIRVPDVSPILIEEDVLKKLSDKQNQWDELAFSEDDLYRQKRKLYEKLTNASNLSKLECQTDVLKRTIRTFNRKRRIKSDKLRTADIVIISELALKKLLNHESYSSRNCKANKERLKFLFKISRWKHSRGGTKLLLIIDMEIDRNHCGISFIENLIINHFDLFRKRQTSSYQIFKLEPNLFDNLNFGPGFNVMVVSKKATISTIASAKPAGKLDDKIEEKDKIINDDEIEIDDFAGCVSIDSNDNLSSYEESTSSANTCNDKTDDRYPENFDFKSAKEQPDQFNIKKLAIDFDSNKLFPDYSTRTEKRIQNFIDNKILNFDSYLRANVAKTRSDCSYLISNPIRKRKIECDKKIEMCNVFEFFRYFLKEFDGILSEDKENFQVVGCFDFGKGQKMSVKLFSEDDQVWRDQLGCRSSIFEFVN